WKICSVLCLLVLLFWVTCKIQKKFRGVEDSSDEESSSREEKEQKEEQQEQQEHKKRREEEVSLFLADVLRPMRIYEGVGEEMLSLLGLLIKICQGVLSDTFYPMPERPIGVGNSYEGWGPMKEKHAFCLLVPLTAPRGHIFHVEVGTAKERPSRNSRVRVEMECVCGREQEMDMQCFLHASEEALSDQNSSLLHSLCTGIYLDMNKVASWFRLVLKEAWNCMPHSATCSLKVMLARRNCLLRLTDFYKRRNFYVWLAFGVQQGNTDIFLSNHEMQPGYTGSMDWPQSCAVAEVKFFQYIAARSQGGDFCHRYLQVCDRTLVSETFSAYVLKTVLMHLLTDIPLEDWDKRYFLLRMDDIMRYLRCCLEEKRLDHFFIGNEKLPPEIILPQDFQEFPPVNLFQHLEQDPEKHEQALNELEELQDRCRNMLFFGRSVTFACPTDENAEYGEDDFQ
ncbi:inositol 1,4,5-trisphosphate receptor-interacting protein-like 1, partial [Numida meleagris]|uniref:inositol 1,4,5-trisphosphate receptor-interacting protein-like 1 n=1 Tax=Numida meleagris TaxID=8996 RepID=UPI000B3DEFC9